MVMVAEACVDDDATRATTVASNNVQNCPGTNLIIELLSWQEFETGLDQSHAWVIQRLQLLDQSQGILRRRVGYQRTWFRQRHRHSCGPGQRSERDLEDPLIPIHRGFEPVPIHR